MLRFLTLALLASAALPLAAHAQDGSERGARADRPARADRGDRPARGEGPRFQRERTQGGPATATVRQELPDRAAWRERARDRDGQPGWRGNRDRPVVAQPEAAPAPVQPRDLGGAGASVQLRQRDQRREWNRGNEQRREWQRAGEQRRDWNRDAAQRRAWDRNVQQRRDLNRNDGRWNNNRSWNDNRGWSGNRAWNGNRGWSGNWNRGWRNDGRYDWQRYRSANRYAYRLPRYYAPGGWNYGYRRFDVGATLFAGLFAQNYWISDPFTYRLPPVEWPLQWVRYYDDALLVDTETGQVVDSIPGIFW